MTCYPTHRFSKLFSVSWKVTWEPEVRFFFILTFFGDMCGNSYEYIHVVKLNEGFGLTQIVERKRRCKFIRKHCLPDILYPLNSLLIGIIMVVVITC